MKLLPALLISTLISACGPAALKNPEPTEEKWEINRHTYTLHKYNSRRLPDSSFKTTHLYQMGMLLDSFKSVVVRKYKDGKLVNQKEFSLYPDGTKRLSNELIKTYNSKGNLVEEINMMGEEMIFKTTDYYNEEGKKVKSRMISKRTGVDPDDYNLDSAIAHRNVKKTAIYDTTIITTDYRANHTRMVKTDARGKVLEISFPEYSGDTLVSDLVLAPAGDTLSKLVSYKEGEYLVQVHEHRKLGSVDTTWIYKGNIVKSIGRASGMKYKSVKYYNDKGDEIESIDYH